MLSVQTVGRLYHMATANCLLHARINRLLLASLGVSKYSLQTDTLQDFCSLSTGFIDVYTQTTLVLALR